MRQRVGFARALVLEPDVLMMDEPFSALDVLTSENLRNELVSLWAQPNFPTTCVCIVTHNIEEAVLLADRVLVLGSNPGHVRAEEHITLPRPRDRRSAAFEATVDRLYTILTEGGGAAAPAGVAAAGPLTHPLPDATVGGMAGLVEIVGTHGGAVDLPDLAEELSFEVDDLMPLVDGACMLGLLEVSGVQVHLSDAGRRWSSASILASKEIFAHLAATRAPLVKTITTALERAHSHSLRDDFFRDLLHRGFSPEDTEKQLDIAIDWALRGALRLRRRHGVHHGLRGRRGRGPGPGRAPGWGPGWGPGPRSGRGRRLVRKAWYRPPRAGTGARARRARTVRGG